ncbi:hypothetical protein Glove_406g16 [Diversispora epigaea]|uniref:Uncharacterized protein n=1 Tax=Diversispora epigaea TaxID=1348612 RepID=A0A397H3C5_9GLOM|nr:hypothetical protein Glove_406g16 [Diversispora epigaea]
MQSELDLLKQRVIELEGENAKLRETIKEKDEYVKLRDAELNNRIADLERSAEEHAESARQSQTENAELRTRVTKLEQKETRVITSEQEASSTKDISPPIEDFCFDKEDSISVSQREAEPKSLEEKEEDEFVDSMYKEQVGKEIIRNIKEKLRDQSAMSSKINPVIETSHDHKTIQSEPQTSTQN